MEFVTLLWLPVVASTVLVFVASSVIHMVVQWHKSEYGKLANEDEVRTAVRASGASPGLYVLPHCPDMKSLQTPEMQKKFTEGPIAFITLKQPGPPKMGGALVMWFVFILVVTAIAAYVAQKTLAPFAADLTFMRICRVVGAVTFLAYVGGTIQNGIWMGKPWSAVAKEVADGAIYAAITALAFGWLWPHP